MAEIHAAIRKLGATAEPATPEEACRVVLGLSADADLRSIVSIWWEQTLDDDAILGMLRDWNNGVPVFATATHGKRRR